MGKRTDYYHDPDAPAANSLVPGGSAIVEDDRGRILLQRRADSGNWSLPGGVMEIGESIGDAVVREVREETGLDVELTGVVGLFTDPAHVIAGKYANAETVAGGGAKRLGGAQLTRIEIDVGVEVLDFRHRAYLLHPGPRLSSLKSQKSWDERPFSLRQAP